MRMSTQGREERREREEREKREREERDKGKRKSVRRLWSLLILT